MLGCASSPKGQALKASESGADGSDRPELSEPRLSAIDLSVILPALAEPSLPSAPVVSVAKSPETRASSPLETALPPIEPSPHLVSPRIASFDPSSIRLAGPILPQTLVEEAPAAKPAAKAPAKSPAPAAKTPKASAAPKAPPPSAASKADAPAAAQVPSFASTPPSQALVADPASDRQPDIAQRVSVELGSRVEVPLEGTGWTYLGEKDGKDGVLYESRRYEGSGLVFVLNPTRTGEYTLRFQRQDALRGKTNDELVGVTVSPKAPKPSAAAQSATTPTAVQHSASPSTEAAQLQGNSAPAASGSTAALPALPAAVPPDSPEGLILVAKNELAAGKVPSAMAILDRFLSLYPAGMDEAYYLYAFALEQNSPYRDIQKAYSYYKKVSDDYPESPLWDKAQERASYLERHYFEIR
jgi:hypothetical protein